MLVRKPRISNGTICNDLRNSALSYSSMERHSINESSFVWTIPDDILTVDIADVLEEQEHPILKPSDFTYD